MLSPDEEPQSENQNLLMLKQQNRELTKELLELKKSLENTETTVVPSYGVTTILSHDGNIITIPASSGPIIVPSSYIVIPPLMLPKFNMSTQTTLMETETQDDHQSSSTSYIQNPLKLGCCIC